MPLGSTGNSKLPTERNTNNIHVALRALHIFTNAIPCRKRAQHVAASDGYDNFASYVAFRAGLFGRYRPFFETSRGEFRPFTDRLGLFSRAREEVSVWLKRHFFNHCIYYLGHEIILACFRFLLKRLIQCSKYIFPKPWRNPRRF